MSTCFAFFLSGFLLLCIYLLLESFPGQCPGHAALRLVFKIRSAGSSSTSSGNSCLKENINSREPYIIYSDSESTMP